MFPTQSAEFVATTDEEEENEAEVTRDLMKLLTLNYEYDDPMTAEMMNILIPRAAELISCHGGNLNRLHTRLQEGDQICRRKLP